MRSGIRKQLALPLLEFLNQNGGRATAADTMEAVAERLDLSEDERGETFSWQGRQLSTLRREVGWAKYLLVKKGLITSAGRGIWELVDAGNAKLLNAKRGVLLTIFETPSGRAIWSNAEDVIAAVEPGTCDLLFTSPPYAGAGKSYGELPEAKWLDWMLGLAADWKSALSPTGSIMVNLGFMFNRDQPSCSLAPERFCIRMADELNLHLLDRLFWIKTGGIVTPYQWAAIRRVRLRAGTEVLYWFGDADKAKADNRRVLTPYRRDMLKLLSRDARPPSKVGKKPCGVTFSQNSFTRDNGGAIPPNFILGDAEGAIEGTPWNVLPATMGGAANHYYRGVKADGTPVHDAVMAPSIAEFAINFTTEAQDLVVDPFGGSGTTAEAAEKLGRRWISGDRSAGLLVGGRHRLPNHTSTDGWVERILRTYQSPAA